MNRFLNLAGLIAVSLLCVGLLSACGSGSTAPGSAPADVKSKMPTTATPPSGAVTAPGMPAPATK